MTEENDGPFRKSLAKFIKEKRKYGAYKKEEIRLMVHGFCQGWLGLGEAMSEVSKKYERKN